MNSLADVDYARVADADDPDAAAFEAPDLPQGVRILRRLRWVIVAAVFVTLTALLLAHLAGAPVHLTVAGAKPPELTVDNPGVVKLDPIPTATASPSPVAAAVVTPVSEPTPGASPSALPTDAPASSHQAEARAADASDSSTRCKRTKIYPFKTGCPTLRRCAQYRKDGATALYRFRVLWKLGGVKTMHKAQIRDMYNSGALRSRYPKMSPEFIRTFFTLEDALERRLPKLSKVLVDDIQLTLAYVCCVTKSEMDKAAEVVNKFSAQFVRVGIPIHLDDLQCWRERINSFSNILTADSDTQLLLYQFNRLLVGQLRKAGVPVYIDRKEQLPFHVELFHVNTAAGTSIIGHMDHIASSIAQINDKVSLSLRTSGGMITLEKGTAMDNNMYES